MNENIVSILKSQKDFFETGKTKPIDYRIKQLIKLKENIKLMENDILEALLMDVGKHHQEGFVTEIGVIYQSIDLFIKHIKKWAKRKKVKTPLYLLGKSYIDYEPYGSVLIIAPFNYPFQLAIEPLIGALIAGNTAVIKPSELTPNVAKVITILIHKTFHEEYVVSIEGGVDVITALLYQRFDYIFFTGSVPVGKIIMSAAAKYLTPVTLELGGKSPVIVDDTADISLAAKRIIWGKTINNGQTCISPDYVLVHKKKKNDLIVEMKKAIKSFYGEIIKDNKDYGRIVNDRHFVRLHKLLTADTHLIVHGGKVNRKDLFIEPTLLDLQSHEAASMQEEIFGPILPILTFETIEDAVEQVKQYEKPLALYMFTTSKINQQAVLSTISSGNVSINDVIKHVTNHELPFGGVGEAGIGGYHGKYSFYTFSHQKGVYENRAKWNFPGLFPPYSQKNLALFRRFFK